MGKNMKNDKKARNLEALKTMKEKQSRKRREQRKKDRKEKQLAKGTVKTKQEERKEFISSLGKVECYGQRVIAECADQKRKETYLKYVNYEPKLEQDVYYSKETEGKGEI